MVNKIPVTFLTPYPEIALTDVFYLFEVIVIRHEVRKILALFVETRRR